MILSKVTNMRYAQMASVQNCPKNLNPMGSIYGEQLVPNWLTLLNVNIANISKVDLEQILSDIFSTDESGQIT